MIREYDLSGLDWRLSGYIPYIWAFENVSSMSGRPKSSEVDNIKAKVPGSVQKALLDAGIIKDWNYGENSRDCEWVENRHWVYTVILPDIHREKQQQSTLKCMGLDHSGWIYLNGLNIGEFAGSHIPHIFDLTDHMKDSNNILQIIFDSPPRWLGQFGHTSKMKPWKTRFNYTWDWCPRLVQIGICESIMLQIHDDIYIKDLMITTDANLLEGTGIIHIQADADEVEDISFKCSLSDGNMIVFSDIFPVSEIKNGISIKDLSVEFWWPNLEGAQPLYDFTCEMTDREGRIHDVRKKRIGFRNITWQNCRNAPDGADPWICVVNGNPVYLQGFNFQPIRPNYADLSRQDYEKRIKEYVSIGTNLFRINACGFLEYECFYDLCDELGVMVWQEFPLTSSGLENWPPEDELSIKEMTEIARSFISRRQNHASLIMWSGGNELQGDVLGNKLGIGKPCTLDHPMLGALKKVVDAYDPLRRYIATSPFGPLQGAEPGNYGKGLHWDVHGPDAVEEPDSYWDNDDALFRSEIYGKGANPVSQTRKYKGGFEEMPASIENPYWRRPTTWWNDWELIIERYKKTPLTLEEYVEMSQENQAKRLSYAMKRCKDRFPEIGGVLIWGSHETFPLPINSTVLDFEGDPKPAALAIKSVWRKQS